jgi:anti-anti-sigma factor
MGKESSDEPGPAWTFVLGCPGIVTFDPHLSVLRVAGDEDRNTSGRRRRALSAALTAPHDVVVDLSELHFADASVMLDLALVAQRLRPQHRVLRLCRPQPHIRTLIEMVGLDRFEAVAVDRLEEPAGT